jgi:tripartite-type tricarboxylate transporter receptor subunit TctC
VIEYIGRGKLRALAVTTATRSELLPDIPTTKIKARLANMGATPIAGSSADFAKLIADETEKWGKVIRAANIKAE